MNILLASSSSGSRGGGEIFLLKLGSGLAARGCPVMLWCSRHPRMDELAGKFSAFGKVFRSDYANTYDRHGRCWSAALDGRAARRIAREWSQLQPGIVHLNKQNLEDGFDLMRACDIGHLPNISTIHLTQSAVELGARFGRLRDILSRRILAQYKGQCVAVSQARGRALAGFTALKHPVSVIHNGVAIPPLAELQSKRESCRKKLGLGPDDFLGLGIGRMAVQKRPLLFLQAARNILRGHPQARFIWLGDDGPVAPEWDRFVQDHGLGSVIHRFPWQEDVIAYLAGADFYIHPASFEGLPFALLEAMAARLPCAVTRSLTRELDFLNQNNIWLFDENNVDACGWPDEIQRRQLGAAARELMQNGFSIERMVAEYESLYHTILEASH